MQNRNSGCRPPEAHDLGPKPLVFNIRHAANVNPNFRTTLWTGCHMQLTLMCIPVGGEIGAEIHENVDQFLCIESGRAAVMMGKCRDNLREKQCADENYAVLIPAGTWHNIVNIGSTPLKLYSVYAPPQHPAGTVHRTKADAEHDEC